MRKIHQERRGVALLTVVLFFLVMVILLGGLLFATVNNLKNTQTAQKHTSVYYAAESGLNLYLSYVQDLADEAILDKWDLADFESELILLSGTHLETSYRDNLGNPVSASISITEPADKIGMDGFRFISLVSEGYISGITREVSTEFIYQVESGSASVNPIKLEGAVITQGKIQQDSGNKNPIEGPIASNNGPFSLQKCPTTLDEDGNVIKAPISYPASLSPDPTISGCSSPIRDELSQTIIFEPIDLAADFNVSGGFNTPFINDGSVLDLKCESGCSTGKRQFQIPSWPNSPNVEVRLYGLSETDITYLKLTTMPSQMTSLVTFVGAGRLVVFFDLDKNLTIGNGVQNLRPDGTGRDSSKLSIVMLKKGETKYNLDISSPFYGSVLTDANIGLDWNNKEFFGYLVANTTGIVDLKANSDFGTENQPIYFYLPLADINFQANAKLYGSIMANTYTSQSNKSTVVYTKMVDKYPFSKWAPLPYAETETSGEAGDTSVSYMIMPIKEN